MNNSTFMSINFEDNTLEMWCSNCGLTLAKPEHSEHIDPLYAEFKEMHKHG